VGPTAHGRRGRLETIRDEPPGIADAPSVPTQDLRNPGQADLNRLQNADLVRRTQRARRTIEVPLPDPVIDPAELVDELDRQLTAPLRPTQEIAEAEADEPEAPVTPAQQPATELAEASSEQMFDETDEFE